MSNWYTPRTIFRPAFLGLSGDDKITAIYMANLFSDVFRSGQVSPVSWLIWAVAADIVWQNTERMSWRRPGRNRPELPDSLRYAPVAGLLFAGHLSRNGLAKKIKCGARSAPAAEMLRHSSLFSFFSIFVLLYFRSLGPILGAIDGEVKKLLMPSSMVLGGLPSPK